MIFGKTRLELRVGVFVFVGLVIFAAFILSIGGLKMLASGYQVKFLFHFVNGVKVGAPVRFAGVDVGEVRRINFIRPPEGKMQVEIVGWVQDNVEIPVDSSVWVNTLGLLGEKYVEILPGEDWQNKLERGGTLTGNEPIAINEVERSLKDTASSVGEVINKIKNGEGTVGKLISEDAIYNDLEALASDVRRHPWKLFWKTKEKPPR
ncbi:MAG: MlaD family protein [Candidatus Omnitrophica bacterium]|nr:MlaD family protein [Candidatus Omnitrophota bacterium]